MSIFVSSIKECIIFHQEDIQEYEHQIENLLLDIQDFPARIDELNLLIESRRDNIKRSKEDLAYYTALDQLDD